jgi:outer membrane protein assembly factor BamB
MAFEAMDEATTTIERKRHVTGILRVICAGLLTVTCLPYTWARNFIGWQLTGSVETPFVLALVIALAAIITLTWRVSTAAQRRRWLWPTGLAVAFTWVAINVAMFSWRVGAEVPRAALVAAYVPGSLLVPWVAWMFFSTWRTQTRVAVTALLLSLMLAFVAIFRVDGLSGDSKVNFSWRSTKSEERSIIAITSPGHKPGVAVRIVENPQLDYPQFLGPDRTATLRHSVLDRDWSNKPPRELWRRPVGSGWSSFAIVGEYAFTQEQRGDQECVICYHVLTGEEVWMHAEAVKFTSSLGGPGPRATPTVARNRVFAVGATGVLRCLDALSGKRIWSIDILKDNKAGNIAHGVCASPLVLADQVLVCPTGSDGPSLAAYEFNTGRRLWTAGQHPASYSSPIATELAGVPQILLCNSAGLTGHDYESGRPLWHFNWTNSARTNVSQPIVHAGDWDQIFISTGYDKGCALVRVDHSGSASWSVREIWSNNNLKTKFCSAVKYRDHVFGLDDGILACVDLRTGKRAWKSGRYGHGQILRANDLLIVQAELGDVVLGELDPGQWRELGRIKALNGKTWNNPALAGPFLVVRNDHEAACFELPLLQTSSESVSSPTLAPASPRESDVAAPETGSNLR